MLQYPSENVTATLGSQSAEFELWCHGESARVPIAPSMEDRSIHPRSQNHIRNRAAHCRVFGPVLVAPDVAQYRRLKTVLVPLSSDGCHNSRISSAGSGLFEVSRSGDSVRNGPAGQFLTRCYTGPQMRGRFLQAGFVTSCVAGDVHPPHRSQDKAGTAMDPLSPSRRFGSSTGPASQSRSASRVTSSGEQPVRPGKSSPVLTARHLFLTGYDKGKLVTQCFDRATGRLVVGAC